MTETIRIHTLGNGLRAVCRQTRSAVSYIGVFIGSGSRDEDASCLGLAHFVEHTIFKGTRHRRACHISNRMESVGGELNAYTSKEETMVYTNAPAGYAARAIELLADLVADSIFPADEIEREREVVIEEINSYLDSPGDAVYDDFEELIYAGSGLSHNILGTPDSVRALGSEECRAFLDRWYTPGNMVIYVADPSEPAVIDRLLERHFGRLHFADTPHNRTLPPACEPFDIVRDRDGHQAHTIIGARIFGRNDSRRFPLFLLNNYLGGPCMNSRLNRELREQRGLVYTVDSNVSLMSDSGLWTVYFGSDAANVDKCRRLIARELDRVAQNTLSPRLFDSIREQYCGQLTVGSDQRENAAMSMAKSLMYFGRVQTLAEMAEQIRAVTPEQLREVAEMLQPALCSRLTLR